MDVSNDAARGGSSKSKGKGKSPQSSKGKVKGKGKSSEKPSPKPKWVKNWTKYSYPLFFRTPSALRNPTKPQPKEIRRATKKLAAMWRNSAVAQKPLADYFAQATIKDTQWESGKTGCPLPATTEKARAEFQTWLEARGLDGTLILEDVLRSPTRLKEQTVLPGITIQDLLNDGRFKLPQAVSGREEIWDLHLTDFDPHCWDSQRAFLNYGLGGTSAAESNKNYSILHGFSDFPEGTLPEVENPPPGFKDPDLPHGIYLRYHGCSLYAASNILATNMVLLSEPNVPGQETAAGRGFYTSEEFSKAVAFATPHGLGPAPREWELYGTAASSSLGGTTPGDQMGGGGLASGSASEPLLTCDDVASWTKVFHRIVLLVAIPGERSRGGVGQWTKVKEEWLPQETSTGTEWQKRPKWLILPHGKKLSEVDADAERRQAIPFPGLQERLKPGALRSRDTGEIPWTNTDGDLEEQSSVAHLVGFFHSAQTLTQFKRSVGPSRGKDIHLGWQLRLEPIYGRARDWFDIKVRTGGTSPARPDAEPKRVAADDPGSTPPIILRERREQSPASDQDGPSSVRLVERRDLDDDDVEDDEASSAGSFYERSVNGSSRSSSRSSSAPERSARLTLERAPLTRKPRSFPVQPPKDWSKDCVDRLERSSASSRGSKASSSASESKKKVQSKKLFTASVPAVPGAKMAVIDGMTKSGRTEKLRKAVATAQDKEQVYGTCESCKKHKRLKLRDDYFLCHGCWAINLTGGVLPNLPSKTAASSSLPAGSVLAPPATTASATSAAPEPPGAATTTPLSTSAVVVKVDLNDDVQVEDEDTAAAVVSSGASSANTSGAKAGPAEKKAKAKGKKKAKRKPEDGHLSRADL
jgi:hypothetical protein